MIWMFVSGKGYPSHLADNTCLPNHTNVKHYATFQIYSHEVPSWWVKRIER
jgi:hypothetical protein